MTRGPSNRALAESVLIALLVVACAACALFATQPHTDTDTPALTATLAQDIMRNTAASHQETLEQFRVLTVAGPYVRAVITVPEESVTGMPVDIVYEYGWHLVRIEPVRGKQPGPG